MVAELLRALDLKEIDPNRVQRALSWLHAVLGCRPEPHYVVSGGRLIETGRICPVCWGEHPFDD